MATDFKGLRHSK